MSLISNHLPLRRWFWVKGVLLDFGERQVAYRYLTLPNAYLKIYVFMHV